MHDILERAESPDEIPALAAMWGRRHGASESERTEAANAARAAFEHATRAIPAGATTYRELPVLVRLQDGTLVDGRADLVWSDGRQWTVVDYKTDRGDHRAFGQLQTYGLALQRATGLPVHGILLEV